MAKSPVYNKILLKLSGEALQSHQSEIDEAKLALIAEEVKAVVECGVRVALVIGAGNILRGANFAKNMIKRISSDYMGMLATVINGLALREVLLHYKISTSIYSAIAVNSIVEQYNFVTAQESLNSGKVLILTGGTGNPLVTTDSAAALRGVELGVDLVIKATKVDAVYSDDPLKNSMANPYTTITFDEVLQQNLKIMDANAILLCREHNLAIKVCNMHECGVLRKVVTGENVGTLITNRR